MAFNIGNKNKAISEINVTPLVDVMLVLLVIFMVTAPMLYNGIQINLPKTKKVHQVRLKNKNVILTYTSSGEIFIGKEKYEVKDALKKINALFSEYKVQTLYLRGAYSAPYGKVVKLMATLKRAGIQNISLVTELDDAK